MKNTIVPAQITTVEDKIAGNLGFNQLLLLTVPVFLCAALFAIGPPGFRLTPYKYVLGALMTLSCLTLSLRIRGQIVLFWVLIIGRYVARARYFIYNKNDIHLRHVSHIPVIASDKTELLPAQTPKAHALLSTSVIAETESAIQNPEARFYVTNGKGGLRVRIREIQKENI